MIENTDMSWERFTKPGIRNWKTRAEVTPAVYHLCFSSSISITLSLSGCTPPPLWHVRLHHSSGFTWLPVQSIMHRLETQLAGKRTWQAELISGAFSSPIVYLEEVSLNCSPEDYGNKLCKMES